MSFLWGGREKFEKDDNTIRGVYKLNPSFGFIDKKKYFVPPVITITNKYYEDTLEVLTGGMIYESNVSYSGYTEDFYGREYYEDTMDDFKGGAIVGSEVIYNSYIEYRFFDMPFSGGYTDTLYNITGGMIYTSEVSYEG